MTLPVPLTVRLGGDRINASGVRTSASETWVTAAAEAVSFRKEAVGGVRSIALKLKRPIASLDRTLAAYEPVTICDARSGEIVAQGRLADPGRSASSGDGPGWDCVAFGPAQHASDITTPLVYIDRSLSDGWVRADVTDGSGEAGASVSPGFPNGEQGILLAWQEGDALPANQRVVYRYDRLWQAGQKIGGIRYDVRCGIGSGDFQTQLITRTDANYGGGEIVAADFWTTSTLTGRGAYVGGAIPNGRNTLEFRTVYAPGAGTVPDNNYWAHFFNFAVRALMVDKSGNELTGAGYQTDDYVYAHLVVADLLGRLLPEYDGANASIDTSGTYQIKQLVYPDGVTPAQVLDDLMKLEPAYRWTTGPDRRGAGYAFSWEKWPTIVRYEATLDDGGTFPLSGQDVYNRVKVRFVDVAGITRWVTRTLACELLDDRGLIRQATIDLGSEAATQAQAEQAGDNFLAQHNVPRNAGTLAVARPIWDVLRAAWVQPWEIEPGELIRVRGVESYRDALNEDSSDGATVARIFVVDYSSEGNVATLALDADPTDTANALKKLQSQRSRA